MTPNSHLHIASKDLFGHLSSLFLILHVLANVPGGLVSLREFHAVCISYRSESRIISTEGERGALQGLATRRTSSEQVVLPSLAVCTSPLPPRRNNHTFAPVTYVRRLISRHLPMTPTSGIGLAPLKSSAPSRLKRIR